jgi:hypothetical protein
MKKKITLSDISKESPFKVPDGYFEKMQAEILTRIESEKEIVPIPKPNIQWRKWAISAAASLAVFFGVYFTQFYQKTSQEEIEISNLTDQQMIQYLENENVDLADLTENTSINQLELDTIIDENFNTTPLNISEEEINQLEIKYLN